MVGSTLTFIFTVSNLLCNCPIWFGANVIVELWRTISKRKAGTVRVSETRAISHLADSASASEEEMEYLS